MSSPEHPVSLVDEIMGQVDAMLECARGFPDSKLDWGGEPWWGPMATASASERLRSRLSAIESELNDLRKESPTSEFAVWWKDESGTVHGSIVPFVEEHTWIKGHKQPIPRVESHRDLVNQLSTDSDLIVKGLPCSGPIELGDEDGG